MECHMFRALAIGTLILHLAWILWVIFGCLLTRRRRTLAWLHIGSLIYSIVIEVGPWPCPITWAEKWAQSKAGITPYEEDFLLHYLEKVVYPDISYALLVPFAVAVCMFNLGVYLARLRRDRTPGI